MKRHSILISALLLVSLFGSFVQAQTAWDSNVVTLAQPSTCQDGRPASNCPVTGYRIERSASASGTFAALATIQGNTYTHTGAAEGSNCYRAFALSATGESGVSNVQCKTNTRPASPPSPPVLTVSAPTAYLVKPNFQKFAFERGAKYPGKVKVGAACDADRSVGGGFYVVARLNQVTPRPAAGTVLVAKCA